MAERPTMTPVDKHVLDHILTFEFRTGRMPTTKELCFYTKMSHGQLARHLERLSAAGELKRFPRGTLNFAVPK